MVDIYKRYNFEYDENVYKKNLKEALLNKGYKKLSSFYNLLDECGSSSYETARSYYNLRRTVPLDVFRDICLKLDLNATEIMFPGSIKKFDFNIDKYDSPDGYGKIFLIFNEIFYIYNDEMHPDIVNEELKQNDPEKYYKELKKNIDKATLILAEYNYLLQKYCFSNICNNELRFFGNISTLYLKDRETNQLLDLKKFLEWKKELKKEDIIKSFYDKYTFVFQDVECKELLQMLKRCVSPSVFTEINNLMPKQDRIDE